MPETVCNLLPFQKWISPDLVILYITFIPGYWDYPDQLSTADNPLTTGSCTVLYWIGGILPPGLLLSIWIIIGSSQTITGLSPDYGIVPGLSYFSLTSAVLDVSTTSNIVAVTPCLVTGRLQLVNHCS